MNVFAAKSDVQHNLAAKNMIEHLQRNADRLDLTDAEIYYKFPFYRSDDGVLVTCSILLISPNHSVMVIGTSDCTTATAREQLTEAARELDEAYGHIYARLVKNPLLRQGKRELAFSVETVIYAPFLDAQPKGLELDPTLILAPSDLDVILTDHNFRETYNPVIFHEIQATIQGAKGLLRPQRRAIDPSQPTSKGALASRLEAEISAFDLQQKQSYLIDFQGPQRIRGLAGSGKTVILALRAALLHLANPDARVLYTFYTKSLYQHIRRLITRFYRQFDEKDPDWERVLVLHAWGGHSAPGVYSEACKAYGVPAMSYPEAAGHPSKEPFDHACSFLLKHPGIEPTYDYILIDEGQDFPHSFLKLCQRLVVNERFVLAYDELQTIFQKRPPTIAEVFGVDDEGSPNLELDQDLVLKKCYRNPREVLVCAHAIGFGLYGKQVAQLLQNPEHWDDIGYHVTKGRFEAGSHVEIERLKENSPLSISQSCTIDELVIGKAFDSYEQEIAAVASGIVGDLADGLRPDDILVICVDDLNAKRYLWDLDTALAKLGVRAHNIHAASYGVVDFRLDGAVTLSTVHKAKGNEAFMVYVVGVDATFLQPTVRSRNIVFTAMSRAKGWLRVFGIGEGARQFVREVDLAKSNFPFLRFVYPSPGDIQIMQRDLEYDPEQLAKIEQQMADLARVLSPEEYSALLEKLRAKSARPTTRTKKGSVGRTKR